jgi:hypothetical protein
MVGSAETFLGPLFAGPPPDGEEPPWLFSGDLLPSEDPHFGQKVAPFGSSD